MVRWLSAQGHSRRTIAGLLDISMAAVARAQRVTS
jgi:predicted transcriptional regulator